jgi:hypothetical protein
MHATVESDRRARAEKKRRGFIGVSFWWAATASIALASNRK